MNLDPKEKSHAWWAGTLKGAIKGLLIGAAVGVVTAFALSGLIGAFPVLEPVFSAFITMEGGFSAVPLAIFSGVSAMLTNAFTGGNASVAALQAQKSELIHQEKITALEGREQQLEQAITTGPKSVAVQSILARGGRDEAASFAEAETERQLAPSTRTLH